MNKQFDCVEMKHKAAQKIQTKLAGLSPKEELAFWNDQTDSLKKLQHQMTKSMKTRL